MYAKNTTCTIYCTFLSDSLLKRVVEVESLPLDVVKLKVVVYPDLPDEFIDVGNQDHRSLERIQCLGDHRDVAEIHMIRRLIQYEKPGALQDESAEGDQPLLSFRQVTYPGFHDISGDEESGRYGSKLLLRDRSPSTSEELVIDSIIEIQIREILTVVPDLHSRCHHGSDRPSVCDAFKQGALPDAIRTRKQQMPALPQRDIDFLDDRLMILEDRNRIDLQKHSSDILLHRNPE